MSDSSSGMLTRIIALAAILVLGLGFYGFSAHSKLAVAETRLASLEQRQTTLKTELDTQSKLVVENSSQAKSCQTEMQTLKNRAQSAQNAPEETKTKPKGRQS